MAITTTHGGTLITGEHIVLYQMLARRGALKLEMKGLKRHGRSIAAILRDAHGFTTRNKVQLLAEYEALIVEKFPDAAHLF